MVQGNRSKEAKTSNDKHNINRHDQEEFTVQYNEECKLLSCSLGSIDFGYTEKVFIKHFIVLKGAR